jgi:ectoine hydroxylase-related dioxygenase (phytanoyl-CoA dioxygenase family)
MLERELHEAFQRDGAIHLPGLIDGARVEVLRAAIERDIQDPGPCFHGYEVEGGGRFHGNMRLREHDAAFDEYCCHSELPALAGELLGAGSVSVYYDQLFVKEPGTDAPTRWHNDLPYWPIRGAHVMSFWLALDPVTLHSGALEFLAGSHRWGRWFQPEPFAPGGTEYPSNPEYEPIPDIDAEREKYQVLSWEMDAGDVIAFDAMTVHGAPGNQSAHRRRGYTVRYVGPDTFYYAGPGTSHFLHDDALADGERITGARYPIVWPAD